MSAGSAAWAERGEYELWDTESANCLGAYESMADALRAVAGEVEEFGPHADEVRSLALVRLDTPAGEGHVATGEALAALALERLRGGSSAGGAW